MTAAPAEYDVDDDDSLLSEDLTDAEQVAGSRLVISVRMTAEQADRIQAASERAGMKFSTYVRVAALEAARQDDQVLDREQLGRDVGQLLHTAQDMERRIKSVQTQLLAAS